MKVTPEAVAAYEAVVPDDPRVERKKMFGHPAAFTSGNMFFGTFEDRLIARLPALRIADLMARPGVGAFAPREGRPWKEYVQLDLEVVDEADLAVYAREALEHTATLPPKVPKPRKPRAKKTT